MLSAEVVVLPPNFTPPDAHTRPVFHYTLPDHLLGMLSPGHFVLVPFGRHAAGETRLVSGIVFRLVESTPPGLATKSIEDLLDPQPVVSQAQLGLATWMSQFYCAPLCECVRAFAPPGQSVHSDLEYRLVEPPPGDLSGHSSPMHTHRPAGPGTAPKAALRAASRATLKAALVATLAQRGPLRAGQLNAALHRKDWRDTVQALIAQGQVSVRRVLPLPRTRPNLVRLVELRLSDSADVSDVTLGRAAEVVSRRRRLIEFLQRENRPVEVEWAYAESGCNAGDLKTLEQKGLVRFRLQETLRDPLDGQDFVPASPPTLTGDQAAAWVSIRNGLTSALTCGDCPAGGSPPVYLLHGVTGSGKTELYLRAVAETLQAGRRAIVLVPEISLTPQTIQRFAARFAGQVTAWHSQMSLDEKYDTWRRIRAGEANVVIGPRSALFSPLERLGLIVIDEEHESSYKQAAESDLPFELPAYHARPTAIELARLSGAAVILGSATPSLEAYTSAQCGEFSLIELSQRILSHGQRLQDHQEHLHRSAPTHYQPVADAAEARFIDLPPVQIVDMRQELRAGNRHIFSRALQAALSDTLAARQQAILFLNRRGSATFVLCRDCGHVLRCPRCDLPLTYHEDQMEGDSSSQHQAADPAGDRAAQRVNPQLLCHLCNYQSPTIGRCPACGSARIRYFGLGTQRVEKTVTELLPQARLLRWDADTAAARGAHTLFLRQFSEGQADIMIGTQMVAKGLDLPLVTLVGVISADTSLHLPDFRAAERTFQLLAQVAGRAGRGLMGGRVIVQTYTPEHYAIQKAARHDYGGFAQQELAFRRQLNYPPFNRLARLLISHSQPRQAEREAQQVMNRLRARLAAHGLDEQALLGPAACFVRRIRDQYRWQIILRAPDPAALLGDFALSPNWRVDIDPLDLL